MNLFDLSDSERPLKEIVRTKQGGWVGTLPDGYTKTVDGKKFTVRTLDSGTQVLVHELPGGGDLRIYRSGGITWHDDHGELHREDGPAVSWDGTVWWYRHGKLHREDGPAIVNANGTTVWYYRGERHREDGPAVVKADGTVEYWLHDKRVTEEDLP